MLPPIETLGLMRIQTENGNYAVQCDRMSIGNSGELYLCSLTGPQRIMAGVQGFLNSEQKGTIRIDGMRFTRPGRSHDMGVDQVFKQEGNYYRSMKKMDPRYDRVHAIFFTKNATFMPNMGDKAVGLKLSDPSICTTPFLPEWVPHLSSKMRDAGLLKHAFGFQCQCGLMATTPEQIDAIVLELGRAGIIRIPNVL